MKYCVLDKSKICNDCGECLRCDLDPSKQCDNCGKCIQELDPNAEYRSLNYRLSDDGFADDEFDAFLDEPIEIGTPPPLEIDQELVAEWEKRLNDSFKYDSEESTNKKNTPSKLHAIRQKHLHKNQADC